MDELTGTGFSNLGDRPFVDVVDSLLNSGIVVGGEVCISVAEVDLVFFGCSLVLSNCDKVHPSRNGTFAAKCSHTTQSNSSR